MGEPQVTMLEPGAEPRELLRYAFLEGDSQALDVAIDLSMVATVDGVEDESFEAPMSLSVPAQHWTKEQMEVWSFIQSAWNLEMQKDSSWIVQLVHPKHLGWGLDAPAPRGKASLGKWQFIAWQAFSNRFFR